MEAPDPCDLPHTAHVPLGTRRPPAPASHDGLENARMSRCSRPRCRLTPRRPPWSRAPHATQARPPAPPLALFPSSPGQAPAPAAAGHHGSVSGEARRGQRWARGRSRPPPRHPCRVRTKTVKKASRVIIEKYYARLTLDFDTNKRICEEVAIIQSKRLRNKIAGFTTVRGGARGGGWGGGRPPGGAGGASMRSEGGRAAPDAPPRPPPASRST